MRLPTDYTPPPAVAWTGGSPPPAYSYSPTARRLLISHLFREQVRTFAAYWSECPDMSTARIFWNRAKHDAHATMRQTADRAALSYSQTAPATGRAADRSRPC